MKDLELQWHKEQYFGTECVSLLSLEKALKLIIMSNG